MKKSKIDNKSVELACTAIISLLDGHVHTAVSAETESPIIKQLVAQHDWDNLFQNKYFIALCKVARDNKQLQNGSIPGHLNTILDFVGQRTKVYVVVIK